MKNIWAIVFVVLILVVLGLFLFSFQVRETEKALVTFFGKPTRVISDSPGWYLKWPRPINVVYKYDARSHLFETVLEETTTKGGKPINVTSYVVWKIGNPELFRTKVTDVKGAEANLESLLRNTQNTIIGRYYFSDFVNSDRDKIKIDEIEQAMAAAIKESAPGYGIDVELVGINKLGISESTSEDVFKRMSADRKRRTEQVLADGNAEAAKIAKDAESKKKELLAIVEAEAMAIRGSGDAEAAKHYKELEQEQDFAMFLRDIDALKKILAKDTTIVLTAEDDPVGLLKKAPDIKPKGSGK
jgi:membrane protease subunit HflC